MYKLIAHRGDKQSSQENTLAAFFDAIKNDYYGFECDVRQTKDQKFMIYHDALYKGKLFGSYKSNELPKDVPFLEDVLNIDTHKIIMLDIKDINIDVNKLKKTVNEYPDKNIYITSFFDNIIEKLAISNRTYKIGILNYVLNTTEKHFKYDFLCILHALINQKIIEKYETENKELFIYGVKRNDIKDLYPLYIVD